MNKLFPVFALGAAALLSGCVSLFYSFEECTTIAEAAVATSAGPLSGASWVYQLQSADPASLAATNYDVVVMDYSADGSGDGEYTAAQIDVIRAGGPTTVLAYFSIGEAEDYRYYFNPDWTFGRRGQPVRGAPCWLALTNPDWRGNYKVQYWAPEWHAVVIDYLDRILAAGFDGVYLDIIDGYEYWSDSDNREGFVLPERESADRMMNLVLTIANHARSTDPDFLIVPQNGSPILEFDDGAGLFPAGAYLDTISGIGVEDLYYDATRAKDQPDIDARLQYLRMIRDAGKAVLVVDYVDDGTDRAENTTRMADFISRSTAEGFVPYVATDDRELDQIQ